MPSSESNLLNTPLEQLKKQEAQGRVATEERMTRLLYHIEDLERRLSYLESVMDEQLEGVHFFLGRHPDLLVKARIQYEPVWLPEAKPCPW